MRVALLTREYPPDVYGGAGVHVEYLARELAALEDVTVHKWASAGGDGRGLAGATGPAVVDHARLGRPRRLRAAPGGAARGVHRPHDGGRGRGRRRRPLAHLVREPGRAPREADVRHPARRERAQPRAAAALEGRAARGRLRGVEVLRADGDRARRRRHRRVAGHARGHPGLLSGGRPEARPGHLQRHRQRRVLAGPAARTCWSASASTRTGRPSCSSAASPARRAWSTCSRRPAPSTPPRSSSCARARRTRPSWAPRSRAGWRSCASSATACCGSPRCCPSRT